MIDNKGNKIYANGNNLFIKLVDQDARKIGTIDYESKMLIVNRDSTKHLFRKNNSYGFNETILKTATKFNRVKLVIDKKNVYIIPVDVILSRGNYLNFQERGFELQIFLSVDIIELYKEVKQLIYYYKDKPYQIQTESKIKIGSVWLDVIIYECLYDNPEGKIWVREKEDFFKLFKLNNND